MQRIVFTVVIVLVSVYGYSSNEKFYNINDKYGISIREGNSVCKDHNGFIWASSKTGILRLTDDDYRTYELPYEIFDNYNIFLLYNDSSLVAYTNNGQIFQYNPIYDRFELIINLRKVLKNKTLELRKLLIGEDCIWIASNSGFYKYKNKQISLIGEQGIFTSDLHWYKDKEMFIVKAREVYIYNAITNEFKFLFEVEEPKEQNIKSLFYHDANHQLWIGTFGDGLHVFNTLTENYRKANTEKLPKQPILSIEANTDSSLLIGFDGQGVWEVNTKNFEILKLYRANIDNPNSLRGNGVYTIFNEDNKRIWVSTYSGGISYFEKVSSIVDQITHQINNPNSLVNNDVNCIIEDRWGKIWMGTDNGISCWDVADNTWRSFYINKQEQANVFLGLCEDKEGRIWAGTYSSGIYVIDGKSGKEINHFSTHEKQSQINADFVFNIFKDSKDNLWIGGMNSPVFQYISSENRFQEYAVNPVNAFAEISDNELLMAGSKGLAIIKKKELDTTVILRGYLLNDIYVSDSIFWLCSSGDGLIRYNKNSKEVIKFTTESGVPSNFINSIVKVDNNLWLGTESGICRFNFIDNTVETFSSFQNLSQLSFNRNAKCKLSDGRIAWGTNQGVVLFDPSSLRQVKSGGKIFIQDISISGRSLRNYPSIKLDKPINKLEKLDLSYNQNTFSFELLSIGVAPGSKFSWKMEGLDENWTSPSNQNVISYSNIQNKEFQLKIRMYDSSLSQIIDEKVFFIRIKPPFWKTWYFYIMVTLIIAGLIYLSLWYYIRLLKQKHTEEKVRFFTNTAHDIRTSLTLVKAPFDELSKEKSISEQGKYYLKLGKEQISRLTSVVTQLMDFQKVDIGKGQLSLSVVDIIQLIKSRIAMFDSYAQSKEIKIVFETNKPAFNTAIDELKMEKVLDNLISNAIKYSHPGGKVTIEFTGAENQWSLKVIDQGIGISKKAQKQLFKEFYRGENAINTKVVGSGIGLLLVKNYISMHHGDISCISNKDQGATFAVSLPVNRKGISGKIIHSPIEKSNYLSGKEQSPIENSFSLDKNMKVLIVEDNDDLRNFISQALSNEFEVSKAEDGKEAWERVQKNAPDLIVSDIMMPNMDGFELCEKLKSSYETSHIPVLLLSALTGKAEQLHGLGLGADDYLTKPFDIALLQQKIKSIIQNRQKVREKALRLIKTNESEPIFKNEINDKFIKRMLEIANKNMANSEFNRNAFANEMNVSESLLYKKTKALTDQSPSDFINSVRLNHSHNLLQTKKYSISEISELCGYSSLSYFSTAFKKYFGKSPTEV